MIHLLSNLRILIRWSVCVFFVIVFPYSQLFSVDEPSEVEKLATTNSPWKIAGRPGREKASHGKVFDARESDRIEKQVALVINKNEELWLELVSHLKDDRHSGIVGLDAGYPRNWTVGDVCQNIIADTLSAPFYRHFPGTKMNYHRFKMPTFAKDKGKLEEWCMELKDKKLYELQIEACNWAIEELESPEIREWDLNAAQKLAVAAEIRQEIKSLTDSQKPVPLGHSYDIH